jgi:hypothetical protein
MQTVNVYCSKCNYSNLNVKIHCGIAAICNNCESDRMWGGLYIVENKNHIPLSNILYAVSKNGYEVRALDQADLTEPSNPFIPWASTLNGLTLSSKNDSEVDAYLACYQHAKENNTIVRDQDSFIPFGKLKPFQSASEKLYVHVTRVGKRRKYIDDNGSVFIKAFNKAWKFPEQVEH